MAAEQRHIPSDHPPIWEETKENTVPEILDKNNREKFLVTKQTIEAVTNALKKLPRK